MGDAFQVVRTAAPGELGGPLFVHPAFIAFQAQVQDKALVTFSALDAGGESCVNLTLGGREGVWTTPVTGAFGGLAHHGRAPPTAVFAVVEAATAWLGESDVSYAQVRLAPDAVADPASAVLENALFRAGWRLANVDLNYHLLVAGGAAFLEGLGETKRKEIRRLRRSGAAFRRLAVADGLRAYQPIAENRAARGFPMTMAWSQVKALAQTFPSKVEFATVERGEEVLAGAICLRLAPSHAYVFYWGETPSARRESPVTLLAEGLIETFHAEGVGILDLGASTEDSIPNFGLMDFKEGLGARISAKRTYRLDRC